MLKPTFINAYNFRSFKKIELDLTPFLNKNVVITGENRDDPGADSNLVGKTNFLKMLKWVCFGTKFIEDPRNEVIRHGEKECVVRLGFGDIEIERRLKGANQQFFYRKKGISLADSNQDTQELFLQDLGVLKSDKVLKTIVNNGIYLNNKAETLLEATPAERISILTDWFDLKRYDQAIEKVREVQKQLEIKEAENQYEEVEENELETLQYRYKQIETDMGFIRASLQERRELQKARDNYQALLNQHQMLCEALKQDKEHNKEVEAAKAKYEELKKLGVKEKLADVEISKKTLKDALKVRQEEYISTANKLEALEKQAEEPLSCPRCNTDLYMGDEGLTEFDVEETKADIKDWKERLKKIKALKEDIEKELDKLEKKEQELLNLSNKEEQAQLDASRELRQTKEKEDKRDSLEAQLKNPPEDWTEEIKEKEKELSSLTLELGKQETRIENCRIQIKKAQNAKETLKKIKEVRDLCILWAGKGRKVGLYQELKSLTFMKIINNLQILTNNYLESEFKVGSKIKIESLSTGIKIWQDKGELHPIPSSLTGGETARIAVSIALSLHKLYSINLGFLLLDEFMALMDESGVKRTLEILKEVEGTKFIVSNTQMEADEHLLLIKEKGITYATV